MDSPPRLHNINVQQSRNSIYPSSLISTSLIPPFSTPLSSLSHTHKHISPHLSLSTTCPTVCQSSWQDAWSHMGKGRRGGGDQRDYRYSGRSQICLLNNSNEEQRVQTIDWTQNMSTHTHSCWHVAKRTKIIGGKSADCERRWRGWGVGRGWDRKHTDDSLLHKTSLSCAASENL